MIRQRKKTKEMKVHSRDCGSELNCYFFFGNVVVNLLHFYSFSL